MAILALAMALMDKWTEVQTDSERNKAADMRSPSFDFIYLPIREKLHVSWDGGCTFNKSILPFLIYKIIDRCNSIWLWQIVKKIEMFVKNTREVLRMKWIQIKDMKTGDILLDADGVEVEVESVSPFGDEGIFSHIRGVEDGIGRFGANAKNAKVRLVKRIPLPKRILNQVTRRTK